MSTTPIGGGGVQGPSQITSGTNTGVLDSFGTGLSTFATGATA